MIVRLFSPAYRPDIDIFAVLANAADIFADIAAVCVIKSRRKLSIS